MTVHNHPPYRPVCNERRLPDGQLRGACLNDDGTPRAASDWRSQVPRSVTDAFTPSGDEVMTPIDRRWLWRLEGWLTVRATTDEQRDKLHALRAYLNETCRHHWQFHTGDELIAQHRRCLWCNDVELMGE